MTIAPERPAPPSRRDAAMAAEASRALSPFGHVLELRLQLGDGGVLLLPRPAVDLLRRGLLEIAQGHAVAVTALDAELTTQEAANHLKVSRPHLIRLLEEGQIRFRRVGTHRRIRFGDLEAYRGTAEEDHRQAIAALASRLWEMTIFWSNSPDRSRSISRTPATGLTSGWDASG